MRNYLALPEVGRESSDRQCKEQLPCWVRDSELTLCRGVHIARRARRIWMGLEKARDALVEAPQRLVR
jgi:hypothetical protein